MKQIHAVLFLAGLGMSLLCSCSGDDNPWGGVSGDEGAIRLSVSTDGSVLSSTRADDTHATIVPGADELKIRMTRTDGSSSKSWTNLKLFNQEESFQIGEYLLEAIYGDRETEGFDNPYYYASQTINVTSGDEKSVSLTATLANCMVSIRYTDEFTSIYPQHSAAVRSSGHNYVVFSGDETRPAYMYPSQMSLSLTLTNSAGKQVTIQPAGFTAQARRHYIVTIGVKNGDQGNVALDVQFEEDVVAETVNVPLGNALFEAPAPRIAAKDFTPDEALNSFESLLPAGDPAFEIYAFGGLNKVRLSLASSSTYNSPFGNEVQLVRPSDLDRSKIEASGLEVSGLFRNPDKMGLVKLKGLVEKLPIGTHRLTLEVEDAMTRISEPMTFVVTVAPVSITIRPVEAIAYMTPLLDLYVSTNCPDIRNKSTFKITSDNLDAEIIGVETLSSAPYENIPSDQNYHYKFTLRAPRNLAHNDTPVKLFYGSKADARAVATVQLSFPKFTVETDAFAWKVIFRIVPENMDELPLIEENLVIIRDGRQVDASRVNLIADQTGEVEVVGLSAATTYSNVEFALSFASNPRTPIPAFTTENVEQIPNGDFSKVHQTLNFSNIQIGGQYRVSPADYTLKSSIERDEADGWASLNQLTCYSGSSNKNTWFMVPSTFVENGVAIIRSVGYSHAGNTPARSGGAFNTTYYCTNSPSDSELSKSTGEMFLGTYTFNGTASRTEGISFSSRPSAVSFDCKYTSNNNEMGEVTVKVFDSAGNIVSEGSLEIGVSANMVKRKVNLLDYRFGRKAARIAIGFRSTSSRTRTPAVKIPTGSELNEGQGLGNHTKGANDYKAFAKGSELEIDNVVLEYEEASTKSSSKNKKYVKRTR